MSKIPLQKYAININKSGEKYEKQNGMSSLDLLLLNVDTLFEQHSVAEVEMVHKRIEEVIENKKEELRTMVGWVSRIFVFKIVIYIFLFLK